MRFKLTTAVLCLGLLAGCASTSPPVEYKNNPQWSEARNVMEAAHIHGMTDLPYKKYQEAKEEALKKGMKLDTGPSLLGGTTFGALNYISPPTGFSSGAAGLMGVASWLLIGNDHPGLQSRIFVWMPMDTSSSPEDAQQRIIKLLDDAAEAAIRETHLPDGYTANTKTIQYDSPKRPIRFLNISGPDCDKEYMYCGYGALGGFSGIPQADIAPDFLGGSNAYVWHYIKYDHYFSHQIGQSKYLSIARDGRGFAKEWYAVFPDVEFFQAFTRHLPKWVYVYLAPQRWSGQVDGKYALPKYPVVINQGRVFYFIEPAPATALR